MTLLENYALIEDYFSALNMTQIAQFKALAHYYTYWNAKINLISRKDLAHLYLRHVLHSLSIAKLISFKAKSAVLDVGTGGGFPGIPLAIFFPDTHFVLVDSIAKKMKVVKDIVQQLGLKNVTPLTMRVEQLSDRYDFVVGRAVSGLSTLYGWVGDSIKQESQHALPNGILYLQGGPVGVPLQKLALACDVYPIRAFFQEPFFQTKNIAHLYNCQSIQGC